MIDEADEFVAGPQNKKRGNTGDPNLGVVPKRRRSMSPLLRRPPTPPAVPNHVLGKGPAGKGALGQTGLIKPISSPKGRDWELGVYPYGALRGDRDIRLCCVAIM